MKEKAKNKKELTLATGFPAKFTPGFTLVEALVAVSIILVGVTAAFGTAQLGLSSTSAVRNRITATFLAQEALEGVKNIKDSNLQKISLNNQSTLNWLAGISNVETPCSSGSPCGYDILLEPLLLKNCGELQDCEIKIENGFYRQLAAVAADTGFVRQISVEELPPLGKEARVTVTISRPGTSFPEFTVTSLIYNWF